MTRFERPLQVELGASRRLAGIGVALHVLAVLPALILPGPSLLQLVLPPLVLAHLVRFVRWHVTASAGRAVAAIAWDRRRGWRAGNRAGEWRAVTLCLPVFVTHRLVMVRFRESMFRSRSAVIVADRLPGDDFRRLRVRLLQAAGRPLSEPGAGGSGTASP